MTVDVETRTGRVRGWVRGCRRGFLGLAAGMWLVGCIYGLFTVPIRSGWQCSSYPYAGDATRQLLILELVLAAALALAVWVTEHARRPSDLAVETGSLWISRPLWSVGIVWSLFGLIALQDTGIAPFLGYIPIDYLPQARGWALVVMWAATIVFGVAAVAHTVVVAVENRSRLKYVASTRGRRPARALIVGALIGIGLAVPMCVTDWNNPDECIALSL
ncbi:hypothetical protein ACFXO9_21050 [Nocardia tengchongensis]|uniref:hypothetical protein n=1 Tax=Nocardia tengchongensis TaxID=2055889 RepID=UPI0036830A91